MLLEPIPHPLPAARVTTGYSSGLGCGAGGSDTLQGTGGTGVWGFGSLVLVCGFDNVVLGLGIWSVDLGPWFWAPGFGCGFGFVALGFMGFDLWVWFVVLVCEFWVPGLGPWFWG